MVNIVTGDGAAGAALVRSGVDKVAFTGSTAVGKEIQRALAGTGTGLTLELGGKSANIVFEDAALDQAVEGIIEGIFFNQGHVCCAGSRLLLQESVAEEVVRKLWARMERLRVGDPLDKNTDVGAINSAAQLARISELVEAGEREGATRRSITCALPETGYWFPPTMFLDVAPANRITVEEIFGPVVSVMTFRTPKEAVERANNSAYGLAAGVWTDNGAKAFEVASVPARRRRLAEHVQQVRPDGRVRRLQGERLRPRGRTRRPAAVREVLVTRRSLVAKTYKLYLGGAFVRSESGRSDTATDHAGAHVANVPRSSRKDVRDAVKAARGAFGGWSQAHRLQPRPGPLPLRRGAWKSRSDELARAADAQQDAALPAARAELGAAVDLLVHYAGWTDKLPAVMGGINPVAAPYLSFSTPEPTGVVAVLAPDEPDILGLIREVAPALAAGNTVVALVSRRWPLRALDLGEVAGVSDVPGGVLNLLCGRMDELRHPALRPPRRQRDRRRERRERAGGDDRRAGRGDRQARHAPRAGRRHARAAGGADGAQDRLAPGRHVGSLHRSPTVRRRPP